MHKFRNFIYALNFSVNFNWFNYKTRIIKNVVFFCTLFFCLFLFSEVGHTQFDNLTSQEAYLLDAETINYDYQGQQLSARNDVEFIMGDLLVNSDYLLVDFSKNILQAEGRKLLLESKDREISGEYLEFDFAAGSGYLLSAHSEVANINFSGGVINLYSEREYDVSVEKAAFTPCQLEEPHYQIKASQVKIYPQQRITGREIELWWRDRRLLGLPAYVVNYEQVNGNYRFSHPFPLPHLGYNSELGLQLEINYPYRVGDNIEGIIELDYEQLGESVLGLDNQWWFYPGLALESSLEYGHNEDDFYGVYTGFRWEPVTELVLQSGIEYYQQQDVNREDKQPVLQNRLFYQRTDYWLEVLMDYHFTGEDRWQLEALLAADLNDYLGLEISNEQPLSQTSFLLEMEGSHEFYPALEGEVNVDLEYIFQDRRLEEFAGELELGVSAHREDRLADQLSLESQLEVSYRARTEDFSSWSEQELLVSPEFTFSISGEEPHSYWQPGLGVEYDVLGGDWQQLSLGFGRKYDCFDWGFNYDFKNDIISFSVNF